MKLTKAQIKLLMRAEKADYNGAELNGAQWTTARVLERQGLLEGKRFAIGRRFITPAGREALRTARRGK